ncbi:MAG: hypothetical protein PHD37_00420 [Gallionellaceae bacterium]|nr:hypothetical protein [Gallionellaceae bacterium]
MKPPLFGNPLALALAAALLAGCQTLGGPNAGTQATAPRIRMAMASAAETKADSTERKVIAAGLNAFRDGDYATASRIFSAALKLSITKSELHLLNALTYHMQALDGDSGKFELAEEGYRLALQFDPANWQADYYLGLCYLDQRKYAEAERHLARAAAGEGDDPDLLYDLAVASYLAGDPRIAEGALAQLGKLAPGRAGQADVLRAEIMTKASLNDDHAAANLTARLRAVAPGEAVRVESRLRDWANYYAQASATALPAMSLRVADSGTNFGVLPGFQVTPGNAPAPGFAQPQGNAPGFAQPPGFGQATGFAQPQGFGQPQGFAQPGQATPGWGQAGGGGVGATPFIDDKMVVVDVVLISTQEDARDSYGMNLLNGLKLQFGDPLTQTPGVSRSWSTTRNLTDPTQDSVTKSLTRSIRIPAITYSLNIANAINTHDDVIAKPSLVALAGQTSEFFSGTEVAAAAVSGGAGDSVSIQKEVGVKLAVRPDFLPDGRVRLQITAQRTFLTDPSTSVVFQYRLDTTKTVVNANVVMKFGETLILSGLTEKDTTSTANGVPGLRQIPGLNLLFSQHNSQEYQKSILILLTPRRPIYSAQSPEDRKATLDRMNEYERDIARLEQRHQDWFRPRASFDEAMERLRGDDYFREFRASDLKPVRWEKRESNEQRLSTAIDRLFL